MAHEHENQHLTEAERVEHYYAPDASPAAARHLQGCADCRAALTVLDSRLDLVATHLREAATAGLGPHFFAGATRAVMARLNAAPTLGRSPGVRWWQPLAATAALIIMGAAALTLYVGQQRQYDRLWAQADAVVEKVGPLDLQAQSFLEIEEPASPGFPIAPEAQDPVEAAGNID